LPETATRVDFYILSTTGLTARLRFACRLVEKAYLLSHRIYAHTATAADARQLDDMLWTFRQGSFIPHQCIEPDRQATAPVTIGADTVPDADGDLLINLAEDLPAFYASFTRVAEIVDGSADGRVAGRARFKAYRDKGCALDTHQIG
jgi:DNA polymerase-3 subunit chi